MTDGCQLVRLRMTDSGNGVTQSASPDCMSDTVSNLDWEDSMTKQSSDHTTPSSATPAEASLTRRTALAGAAGLVGVGIVEVVGAGAQTDDATAVTEEPSL